jgi:hypothetical protein
MENEQKLELLNSQKRSVDHDLTREQYELSFLLGLLETEDLPSFSQGDLEYHQAQVPFLQKKLDWYDLKIEELTAIIENTN